MDSEKNSQQQFIDQMGGKHPQSQQHDQEESSWKSGCVVQACSHLLLCISGMYIYIYMYIMCIYI